MGFDQLLGRMDYAIRSILLQTAQPVLLGDRQTFTIGKGPVKLIVIGELKFRENLVNGIHMIRPCRAGVPGTGSGFGILPSLPSCDRRCAGTFL